jgi:hypothetical protein
MAKEAFDYEPIMTPGNSEVSTDLELRYRRIIKKIP